MTTRKELTEAIRERYYGHQASTGAASSMSSWPSPAITASTRSACLQMHHRSRRDRRGTACTTKRYGKH